MGGHAGKRDASTGDGLGGDQSWARAVGASGAERRRDPGPSGSLYLRVTGAAAAAAS